MNTASSIRRRSAAWTILLDLDVSVKETSICIVDDAGKIVREVTVASEPEALLAVLKNPAYHFKRIGLEAGPLSRWLFSALAEAGLPVICVETRHYMQAVLKAQINKTDRNDARGIAQMMRAGLYRPVHVKTLRSQKLRMLLTHRKLLQSKAIAIENDLRATLRNFGLKVGMVGTVKFDARINEAYVIHASSVAVSREHWRAKTDRLDTELLKRSFLGWLRGERDHCKMVEIRDSRHAGARGVVAKHARPTGRSALCRPHWFTRRERKETPRERAGPLGQCPGPPRHDSIGVAVPSTPKEQRLDEVVSIPHRERSRYSKAHDRGLGAQATDRPVAAHAGGHCPGWRCFASGTMNEGR